MAQYHEIVWTACTPNHCYLCAACLQAESLCKKTLSLADSKGVWVEYYVNDQPQGTRCRSWESTIHLEALLAWVLRRQR